MASVEIIKTCSSTHYLKIKKNIPVKTGYHSTLFPSFFYNKFTTKSGRCLVLQRFYLCNRCRLGLISQYVKNSGLSARILPDYLILGITHQIETNRPPCIFITLLKGFRIQCDYAGIT